MSLLSERIRELEDKYARSKNQEIRRYTSIQIGELRALAPKINEILDLKVLDRNELKKELTEGA